MSDLTWSDWAAFIEDTITQVPRTAGVYGLAATKGTFYYGTTDDLPRRLWEHYNSDDPCIKQTTVFRYESQSWESLL